MGMNFYENEARILGLHMTLTLLEIEFRLILIELILRDMGARTTGSSP